MLELASFFFCSFSQVPHTTTQREGDRTRLFKETMKIFGDFFWGGGDIEESLRGITRIFPSSRFDQLVDFIHARGEPPILGRP